MKSKYKIVILISIVFVVWVSVAAVGICLFVDGPSSPEWLGSHGGCGPYVTYEIQKYFGILWYE